MTRVGDASDASGVALVCAARRRGSLINSGWCVMLLMRHLGIDWGLGYPREQVWAVPPPDFSEGLPG